MRRKAEVLPDKHRSCDVLARLRSSRCWKWRGDVSIEINDPLFTPPGIDLWDMMDRITLEDPEYAKVLVLPKDDGRFDDAEEDLELKEVSAKDCDI
ncbi:hypothetical protein RIF29_20462 [Crotalaria pallida]|uniref:Uncharacterized protein n=1 Tax=Crotalaria pallida TaxID=3830 RepID=A0AAN9F9R3_CROPI